MPNIALPEAMEETALTDKVLKGHERQIKLAHHLIKVGHNTALGKTLRLQAYYRDVFLMLQAWRDFITLRKEKIGDTYLAADNAIVHSNHAQVEQLVQVEPQLRGNDLGIIKILAPGYMLGHPLSLGRNGKEHAGIRSVFQQALPDPFEQIEQLSQYVERFLAASAQKGTLHIENDLTGFMLTTLHRLVFQFSPLKDEIAASRAYIKRLPLAALPNVISRYLLWFKTWPSIRYRRRMVRLYQSAASWPTYVELGSPYGLSPDAIANSLFDLIHISGTTHTSALLGSVIGMLCAKDGIDSGISSGISSGVKMAAIAEINAIWENRTALDADALRQASILHSIVLETARLYPPVRFVSQLAQTEGTVEIGSQKCPFHQGTRLLGSIFTANRDAQRYEAPHEFSTSRDFSDLLSWNGNGHERTCPGRSLSIELIKLFCLHLFKHYQWEQPTEVKWDFKQAIAVTPSNLVLQSFAARAI